MQRYGLPIVLAVLVALAFIAFRGFGGDGDPELPIDIDPVAVTHSSETGLTIQLVNNSENAFNGGVRVRVTQEPRSVTATFPVEIAGFGTGEGTVEGDWVAGDGSPTYQLVIDPQNELNDTNIENNTISFVCAAADGVCTIER